MNKTREYVLNNLIKYVDEKKAKNIEKCILNFTIQYSKENNIEQVWENYLFSHIYKQKYVSLINIIRTKEDFLRKINDKSISTKNIAFLNYNDIYDSNIQEEEVSDGLFECRKCGSKKTTYYSLQTRSADEPMTNFITCTVCDNRWKM